jgi:hypothetical protein
MATEAKEYGPSSQPVAQDLKSSLKRQIVRVQSEPLSLTRHVQVPPVAMSFELPSPTVGNTGNSTTAVNDTRVITDNPSHWTSMVLSEGGA